MGFPVWTLIGMGASIVGALAMAVLTYVSLSPELLTRLRLSGRQLPTRVREFVGYIVACLLLMVGFFLAGVPLAPVDEPTAVTVIITATPMPTAVATATDLLDQPLAEPEPTLNINPEDSGSFGSSLDLNTPAPEEDENELAEGAGATAPVQETAEATAVDPTATEEEETAEETSTPQPTATQTPTRAAPATSTATQTATATSTPSPEPTQTPVPPEGETAVIQTGGNTLWVRQTPGGRTLTLLSDGDTVVLSRGVANWEGEIWQEIRTLDGILGWVQLEFLESQ